MNDEQNKDLIGLEIEITNTKTGKDFIVFQFEGKHYKAWINEKTVESKSGSGKTWSRKWAVVRLCDYNNCGICENGIVK